MDHLARSRPRLTTRGEPLPSTSGAAYLWPLKQQRLSFLPLRFAIGVPLVGVIAGTVREVTALTKGGQVFRPDIRLVVLVGPGSERLA